MKASMVLAGVITSMHLALWLLGAGEHVSFLAGQPLSSASFVLGPLYVASYLALVVVVPTALGASVLMWTVEARRRESRPPWASRQT